MRIFQKTKRFLIIPCTIIACLVTVSTFDIKIASANSYDQPVGAAYYNNQYIYVYQNLQGQEYISYNNQIIYGTRQGTTFVPQNNNNSPYVDNEGWTVDNNDIPSKDPQMGWFLGNGTCKKENLSIWANPNEKENYNTNCTVVLEKQDLGDTYRFTEELSAYDTASYHKLTKSTTAEMAWKISGEAGLDIKSFLKLKVAGEYGEKTINSQSIETNFPGVQNPNYPGQFQQAALVNIAKYRHYLLKVKMWDGTYDRWSQQHQNFRNKTMYINYYEPTQEHLRGHVVYGSRLYYAIQQQKNYDTPIANYMIYDLK
ncbi:TPA: hypothetical protein QCY71_005778 [Bacillus cereus]|nr:hypothetical protein [Bacillus cereus]